jgi:threonine dehydrogenase-like Zn-dependent dehydrogenase
MKNRMAMVKTPEVAELVEVDLASLGETQVLIAIKASSICGSDLHIYKGKHPSAALPVSIGHELSGDVIQAGAGVDKVQVGDRVTVEPVVACGRCLPCQTGHYGYCDNLSYHYRKGQGALADYSLWLTSAMFTGYPTSCPMKPGRWWNRWRWRFMPRSGRRSNWVTKS